MNERVLYQWEREIAAHLPSLNSWQGANVALMSYGVLKAGGCQQRQMRGTADTALAEQEPAGWGTRAASAFPTMPPDC